MKDQKFSVDRHTFHTEILSYSSCLLSLEDSIYLYVSATQVARGILVYRKSIL